MRIIRPRIFTLCILLIPAISLYAADLTVPKLDLLTTGNWNKDTNRVDLVTTAETKIAISGGISLGEVFRWVSSPKISDTLIRMHPMSLTKRQRHKKM